MIIKNCFATGIFDENSFIITDEETGKVAIIDPGFQSDQSYSDYNNIDFILLTHGHFDHVYAVNAIKEKYGSKIVCHKDETVLLGNPNLNASATFGEAITVKPDIELDDGEKFMLGNTEITVMHTPGHTSGSCCYIADGHIFTGDTVFEGTVGRTDLPTGDYFALMKSIDKLKQIYKNYILHCGHGNNTSLDKEKRYNEFFRK